MANSADPDQLADLDLHHMQRQDISGFSRTRVLRGSKLYRSIFMMISFKPLSLVNNYSGW